MEKVLDERLAYLKKFGLNKMDNYIQIYGSVNGFARKREYQGIYGYVLNVKFFVNNKLISIKTSEEDNTIRDESCIIARINSMIERKLKEESEGK